MREDAELSQDKLGEMMTTPDKPDGVLKATVSSWENDRNQVSASQIIQLCEIFRVSPGYLLFGKESLSSNTARIDEIAKLITTYGQMKSGDRQYILEQMAGLVSVSNLHGSKPAVNES